MPEVKKFVYRSPDGVLRGPIVTYNGRCPHCSSMNVVGRGGFDECAACGTRIRAHLPEDVCVSPTQPVARTTPAAEPKKNPFARTKTVEPAPKGKKGRK